MALTPAELEAAVREFIDRQAPGAPDSIRALAADRMASYLALPDETMLGLDGQQMSRASPSLAVLRASGAGELLAPYRRPRARVVEAAS